MTITDEEANGFADFKLAHPDCWVCGRAATEIHHICGRNHREAHHRTNLFSVCRRCHESFIPAMLIVTQVAIKQKFDAVGTNLEKLRELRHAKNGRCDL